MKKYTIYILSIVLLVAIALLVGIFLFNKKPENTAGLKSEIKVNALSLLANYKADEAVANTKYMDKVIEITGHVAEIQYENNGLVILLGEKDELEHVQCTMLPTEIEKIRLVKVSSEVTIRGYCAGYLLDVIINRAIFVGELNHK